MQLAEELLQLLDGPACSFIICHRSMAKIAGSPAQPLAQAVPDLDWSDEAFSFMAVKQHNPGYTEIECRIARISFSGERAFELYVNADNGAKGQHLADFVARFDGCLYGMEALVPAR